VKVKTSELSGVQLDYAVAWSVDWGQPVLHITSGGSFVELMGVVFSPTSNWSQCGPMIADHKLNISHNPSGRRPEEPWFCCDNSETFWSIGETAMVAICRAVVAAKLGDEVDIPNELMEATR